MLEVLCSASIYGEQDTSVTDRPEQPSADMFHSVLPEQIRQSNVLVPLNTSRFKKRGKNQNSHSHLFKM